MNLMQIAGNLGADPVTRFTATGQKVTTFTVAVNTKRGENVSTTWYRVTVWGDRFEKMMTYLKKEAPSSSSASCKSQKFGPTKKAVRRSA